MERSIYLSSLSINVEPKAGDPRFLGRDRPWLGRLRVGRKIFRRETILDSTSEVMFNLLDFGDMRILFGTCLRR
jgi:hypothetical protein